MAKTKNIKKNSSKHNNDNHLEYKPLILPSDFSEMDLFLRKNKFKLSQHVVASIDHAIKNKLTNIEIFKFKNSDYVIVLFETTFEQELKNIYEYYIKEELYESCNQVIDIQKRLKEKVNSFSLL